MIRSRNEAANKVAEASKAKADVLQLAVTESRSNTAAEVDHIVPVSKAPRFENWIGNLEFMPRTLNRRKSDRVEK